MNILATTLLLLSVAFPAFGLQMSAADQEMMKVPQGDE